MIKTRQGKGSPLTISEIDGNFTYLYDSANTAYEHANVAYSHANVAYRSVDSIISNSVNGILKRNNKEIVPAVIGHDYCGVWSGNRTYYVRKDGNDSNDGLSNTANGAWLTVDHAIDEIYKIKISSGWITLQIGNGNYDDIDYDIHSSVSRSGALKINGNSANNAEVRLGGIYVQDGWVEVCNVWFTRVDTYSGGSVYIRNCTVGAAEVGYSGLGSYYGSDIRVYNCSFLANNSWPLIESIGGNLHFNAGGTSFIGDFDRSEYAIMSCANNGILEIDGEFDASAFANANISGLRFEAVHGGRILSNAYTSSNFPLGSTSGIIRDGGSFNGETNIPTLTVGSTSGILKRTGGVLHDAIEGIDYCGVWSGNRTYYVRGDGNDSNDGLSDTTNGAFLTISRALDEIQKTKLIRGNITIQIGDGFYEEGCEIFCPMTVDGYLEIKGNSSNISAVRVAGGMYFQNINLQIKDLWVTRVDAYAGSWVDIRDCKFGEVDYGYSGVGGYAGSYIRVSGACEFLADNDWYLIEALEGGCVNVDLAQIKFTGNFTRSAYPIIKAYDNGIIKLVNSFSGTSFTNANISGPRFSAVDGGKIVASRYTSTNFPLGSTPGITANSGSFNGEMSLSALNINLQTAPASNSAIGVAGEIRFDSNNIYYCVAANTWKRATLSTW